MTWDELFSDWSAQVNRLVTLFPHADRCALVRFRGNRRHLAEYLADSHDLTTSEGLEAIELRLLPSARTNRARTGHTGTGRTASASAASDRAASLLHPPHLPAPRSDMAARAAPCNAATDRVPPDHSATVRTSPDRSGAVAASPRPFPDTHPPGSSRRAPSTLARVR